MSTKASLDSDLYGDIYGDDDNDFGGGADVQDDAKDKTAPETIPPAAAAAAEPEKSEAASAAAESSPQPPSTKELPSSLPAKPAPQTAHPSSSLSYSAQIAQQFSSYQQTPSQERQQRPGYAANRAHGPSISKIDSPDSVFGKKPSEMHDAGKLFIGGLNWDTTDEGLRNYFSEFGKVDACTIMRDPNGTSRGFAFLTFEDPSAVDFVMGREHYLDGKSIDPKRAIPREEHLRNTRYFVGGLAANTSSESMREFFSTYGTVVDATVMLDRETGRSKGFGFVTFDDSANCDQLVGKNLVLDDKQIEVKMAQPRSQRDQSRSSTHSPSPNTRETFFNPETQPRAPVVAPTPFMTPQPQMMFQRPPMTQVPMMGAGAMPMMNMNPMGMAMGMGGMNGMMNPMGGMNMNMMPMNGMGMMGMGNMGPMRLGMGPIGGAAPMGMMAMAGRPGMRMAQGQGYGRMPMQNATGLGPARVSSRGQHNFHPYSR